MDCRIKSGNDGVRNRSRDAIASEAWGTKSKNSPPNKAHDPEKWRPVFGPDHAPRKEGRAPTGASIHYPRHTRRRCRLKVHADKFTQSAQTVCSARKRPQRGPLASRRSTAALATQINAMAQPRPRFARNRMRRRYLRFESRLQRCTSRSGHSAGRSMPKPPGSGVTKPARRNRTRSVSRPSPVDVPHMSGIEHR
jgi:hypothetical protein